MPTIAVTNDNRLSNSIIRFLHFYKQDYFVSIDFNQFKKEYLKNLDSFSKMIIDVYEDFDKQTISTGIQYGLLFEKSDNCISYFFTINGLKKDLSINDLSPNCFYLPVQLNEFLNWIKNMQPVQGSSSKLQHYFLSSPITNDHN